MSSPLELPFHFGVSRSPWVNLSMVISNEAKIIHQSSSEYQESLEGGDNRYE